MTLPIWYGTDQERVDLLKALEPPNCTCTYDTVGSILHRCSLHEALLGSQDFLDHLLYGRRIAEKLKFEEFNVTHGTISKRRT